MSALDLDAIEAREMEATPGPWESEGYEGRVTSPTAVVVDGITMWAEADAEFIAHAREDVHALVAALRAAEAERDRLAAKVAAVEALGVGDLYEAWHGEVWAGCADRDRWLRVLGVVRAALATGEGK